MHSGPVLDSVKRNRYHQGALRGCRLEDQRHCHLLFDVGGPGDSPGAGQKPEELCAKLELSSKFLLLCFPFQSLRIFVAGGVPSTGTKGLGHCRSGRPFLHCSFLSLIPLGDPAPVLEISTHS